MSDRRLLTALLRSDLSSFIQKVFQTVSPGDAYRHGWHIDAIAYALHRCLKGEIRRLIITLPPRSLKSIAASVAFPAFVLGRDPRQKVICVSYSQDLSNKHARDCRIVIEADSSPPARASVWPPRWAALSQVAVAASSSSMTS